MIQVSFLHNMKLLNVENVIFYIFRKWFNILGFFLNGLMKIALAHFPGEYSFSEYDELLTRARLAELVLRKEADKTVLIHPSVSYYIIKV